VTDGLSLHCHYLVINFNSFSGINVVFVYYLFVKYRILFTAACSNNIPVITALLQYGEGLIILLTFILNFN